MIRELCFRFEHSENWGSSLYEYVSLLVSHYCEVHSVFVSCCPKRMALTQGFSKGSKTCIWSKSGRIEEHRLGIFDGESLQGDAVCDAVYTAKHFCTKLVSQLSPSGLGVKSLELQYGYSQGPVWLAGVCLSGQPQGGVHVLSWHLHWRPVAA